MKYLKRFNESLDTKSIQELCKYFDIQNYTVNRDGSIDVNGTVYFDPAKKSHLFGDSGRLPLKFNHVSGNFLCSCLNLTTLEGSPNTVGGSFFAELNKLTDLKGAPQIVNGSFYCVNNDLTSLIGGPREVGFKYACDHNTELKNLIGAPKKVEKEFTCSGCTNLFEPYGIEEMKLTNFDRGDFNFYCSKSPIKYIFTFFLRNAGINPTARHNKYEYPINELSPTKYKIAYKNFIESLDYPYIKGNTINKNIFAQVCNEFNLKMPSRITNYKFVLS